jgi:hypothetical protein
MGGIEGLRLLLDTHIILWSSAEPEKLSQNITNELEKNFKGVIKLTDEVKIDCESEPGLLKWAQTQYLDLF